MTERGLRIRLGLFVVAALALLGVLIVLFGSYPSFYKRHTDYTIVFSEAPGIGPGAPVRRSGVRIGDVKSVALDDESGQVRVVIQVEKPYTLRHSEQATIVTNLLGGDSTIDFLPRRLEPDQKPDTSPVDPSEELAGVRSASVNTLLSQASDVVPTTQEILVDIRKSLKRLDTLGPVTEETVKEYRDLAKETRKSIPELMKTNDELQTTARNWGKLGERLDLLLQTNQEKLVRTIDNLNDIVARMAAVLSDENQRNLNATLKNIRTSSDDFPSMTKNADEAMKRLNETMTKADELITSLNKASQPFAERAPSLAKNLDESVDKLNKALTDAKDLLRAIGEGDGAFRKFIMDPSLYNHLDDAACQLSRMMPRVDRILKDAETFADKLARHPELIGAGGAIRPSSGLKDGPSSSYHDGPPSFWPSSSYKPQH
jgi:phospholipid/cholesterol/gamma-HCH transport system substrate-binding protein